MTKIVFMGTPEFAVPSLDALLDAGYHVAGVFTQPDRPAGRGKKLTACPVKARALERGCEIDGLVEAVLAEYRVSRDQARTDVVQFLENLSKVGCLEL